VRRELSIWQVVDEIYVYSLSGEKITRIAEDSVGSAYAAGREQHPWLFVYMSGFTSPATIGLYDFSAPEHKRWSIYRTTVLKSLDPDEFEARQVNLGFIVNHYQ
jgi:prolyl oligopeptidase